MRIIKRNNWLFGADAWWNIFSVVFTFISIKRPLILILRFYCLFVESILWLRKCPSSIALLCVSKIPRFCTSAYYHNICKLLLSSSPSCSWWYLLAPRSMWDRELKWFSLMNKGTTTGVVIRLFVRTLICLLLTFLRARFSVMVISRYEHSSRNYSAQDIIIQCILILLLEILVLVSQGQ